MMVEPEAENEEGGQRSDARENRVQILLVAKRLFTVQGVAETSMKEIARAAGVGQGTLYRNFAHKGEVCHALIREDVAEFRTRVGGLIEAGEGSVLARLDLLMSERVAIMEMHQPYFAAMEEAAAGPKRTKGFRGPFDSWVYEQIVRLLDEGIAAGEITAVDTAYTADAMLVALSPHLYNYQRHEQGYSQERIISGMRRLYIEGLRREGQLPDGC